MDQGLAGWWREDQDSTDRLKAQMVPLTQLRMCPAVSSKGTRLKHFTGDPLLMYLHL